MEKQEKPRIAILPLLLILLFLSALIAASQGAFSIPLSQIISGNLNEQQQAVLLFIRLPRILLAIIVGASLAVSGAALQGIFRNPLADPSLIGIAGGAALGVGIVIVIFEPFNNALTLY